MPYFPEINCLFVHIPKTGGTSISEELSKYSSKTREGHKHSMPKKLQYYPIWVNSTKISFVRNPWSVMVSSYHWWIQKADNFPSLRYDAEIVKRMSFSEYMDSMYGNQINEYAGNYQSWLAIDGKEVVDYIGKLETIDQDWENICALLKIPHNTLPVLNKSNHENYRTYYDKVSKEKVANRFEWSIRKFGYEF